MGNDLGMQYIMDGNGNYYTVNGKDQLVVARNREEASVFTFFEANQRIGDGKKAKFYHTIPVDELEQTEEEMQSKVLSIVDKIGDIKPEQDEVKSFHVYADDKPEFEYCMEHVDWSEFVNYYIFLAGGVTGYREELSKRHSDVEKEICDLLHYVELYDLSDEEGLKAMDMLKDARQRRRDIKDEISRTEFFQRMIGTSANVAKARGFLTEMKKLDTRKYFPRQLKNLFDGMEDKATDRNLYREKCNLEEEYEEYTMDEEEEKMSFMETVFDNRENDWLGFARQQMEFYQNAGQYMVNLQIEIREIDEKIEDVMEKIEDANYNVAQGYKVFRELKDLRNERKAKAQEFHVLKIMTECFDMNSMADAFSYSVDEIGKITDDADAEETGLDEESFVS
jgi:hypothetical protein